MEETQAWSSTRFSSWSIISYINDLPNKQQITLNSFPYADNTSIMVTNTSPNDFKINMNNVNT
jgi:hypothetical protein